MVSSFDVCSLYPYVMAILDVYYPCGKHEKVEKIDFNKLGFYRLIVD